MGQFQWLSIFLFVFVAFQAHSAELYASYWAAQSADGYISDISEDTIEPMRELVLITPPIEVTTPITTKKVFTESLSKEFHDQYRSQFGFTAAQEFFNDPVDVSFYGTAQGYSVQEEEHRQARRAYGEYVIKRTAEFHVDNYFKSEPQLRRVYEIKERLSNLDVRVNETTKINTNYSFAGNFVTTTVESPIVHFRAQFDMSGNTPGPIDETTFSISRQLTSTVSAETYYKINSEEFNIVGRKKLTHNIESSIMAQHSPRSIDERTGESLFLLGFSVLN